MWNETIFFAIFHVSYILIEVFKKAFSQLKMYNQSFQTISQAK